MAYPKNPLLEMGIRNKSPLSECKQRAWFSLKYIYLSQCVLFAGANPELIFRSRALQLFSKPKGNYQFMHLIEWMGSSERTEIDKKKTGHNQTKSYWYAVFPFTRGPI